jgi:hypothetical protein
MYEVLLHCPKPLPKRHVPWILLAIWHKVLLHCPEPLPKGMCPEYFLPYHHLVWHKVPCNYFNIYLNWSDARERQGQAVKMTCTASVLPLLRLQSNLPCPCPGKMPRKRQRNELNQECLSPVNRGMPDVDNNLTLSKSTFEDYFSIRFNTKSFCNMCSIDRKIESLFKPGYSTIQ